jgi:RNA polymerase sigma-70 factor (ECF subfamily)
MGRVVDFEEFFGAQYDPIVRSLTLVFGDRAAAEDAAQVGFERALRRWSTVSRHERPGTWVYVVAVRHGRRRLAREAAPAPVADDTSESSHEEGAVTGVWVSRALRSLPPRQRAVVVLRHLGGLRIAEIAEALGVSVGTVKSTLHSAYGRLRVELTADANEGEVIPDAS